MKNVTLVLTLSVVFLAGCFKAKPIPEVLPADGTASDAASETAQPRETIGKTTQVVLDLQAAIADGGVLAATQVTESDPLLQSAAAYRTTVGKLGAMSVLQAIQIRNAQSIQDPKPLSHAALMRDIIKVDQADGIALAMLPYYQEYAWDEANQKLVVVDFPQRQIEREKKR